MFGKLVVVFVMQLSAIHCKHCQEGAYFDSVTGRCDPCYFICSMPEIQGTTEQCHKMCPSKCFVCVCVVRTGIIYILITIYLYIIIYFFKSPLCMHSD